MAGPLSLRLLLQPCIAALFAWRDGQADAASGADPYLKRIFSQPDARRDTIASAWGSIGKVMVVAFVLDTLFQLGVGQDVLFRQSAFMAVLLCAVPYTLLRGPAARWNERTTDS